jgi:RES domain-containing protein
MAREKRQASVAAVGGGRFNRPSVEDRYLADRPEGALREYRGESTLLPPATAATFLVTAAPIVDFRGGHDGKAWSIEWANAYCDWRYLWLTGHTEPPTWTLGDLVMESGAADLLYTSRHGASDCLVLYPSMAANETGFRCAATAITSSRADSRVNDVAGPKC